MRTMNIARLAIFVIVCYLMESATQTRPLPSGPASTSMNSEPLRIALSKIAPLEQWDVSNSESESTVCWKLFRPDPEKLGQLGDILSSFEQNHHWYQINGCLKMGIGRAVPPGLVVSSVAAPAAVSVPSQADPNVDLPKLAAEIEQQLGLQNVEPKHFSEALLTKEGLRQSHGPFEDFQDGGLRNVYLIVNPGPEEVFRATDTDILLHFEPKEDEMLSIFGDLLGTDLSLRKFHAMTEAEADRLQKGFPGLWTIADYNMGAYITPRQAELLEQECQKISRIVFSPKAIRGIDKLVRIAHWASVKHYGVFFDEL